MIFIRLIMFLSALLFTSIAFIWRHKTKPYHFKEVKYGVIYRSGLLRPKKLGRVIDCYGIKTVVNLHSVAADKIMRGWYADEMRICRVKGVNFINIPIPKNTPPTREQVAEWLSILDDVERLPVLVHCVQGVVRTGMLTAIYEMEYLGKTNQKALAELFMFGHELYVPRRKQMRDFILSYVPKRKIEQLLAEKKEPVLQVFRDDFSNAYEELSM